MPVGGKHQGSPSVDGSKPRWSPCHEWVHQIPQDPIYSSTQIRYNTLPQQLIPHGLCSTPPVPPPQYDHIRSAMDPSRVIPGAQGNLFPRIHSHGVCPGHPHEPDTSPPMRWPTGNTLGDIGALTTAWQTAGAQLGHRQENLTDNNGAAHDVPLSIGCKSTGLCSSDAYAPLGASHEQLLAIAPHMWGYSMAAEHGRGNLGLSGEAYLASAQGCGYPRQGFQPAATTAYQDYQAFSAGTEGTTPYVETGWSTPMTEPWPPRAEVVTTPGDGPNQTPWDTVWRTWYPSGRGAGTNTSWGYSTSTHGQWNGVAADPQYTQCCYTV